ncbi:hypothetical protein OFM21_32805, partial [Escherichia coli]|nr:hypothetical protein [Escherichia coli]
AVFSSTENRGYLWIQSLSNAVSDCPAGRRNKASRSPWIDKLNRIITYDKPRCDITKGKIAMYQHIGQCFANRI